MMATFKMQATILKAGHLGSNTSSTLPFINAVQLEATILSYGQDNSCTFPEIRLASGDTIYITSGSNAKEGNGYIKWTGRQVWLNEGDAAQLINPKGEIISER